VFFFLNFNFNKASNQPSPRPLLFSIYISRADAYNTTSFGDPPIKLAHEDSFVVYIGLTSMLQKECVAGTGCFDWHSNVIEWSVIPSPISYLSLI
jgi:hypothetical protein